MAIDPILKISDTPLTTYSAAATRVQVVQPLVTLRGTGLDGVLRAGSHQGWALAGNPFEPGYSGRSRLGDVWLDSGAFAPMVVDLALPAQQPWIIGRSYNPRQWDGSKINNSDGPQGWNWFQTSQPEIILVDNSGDTDDHVYLVYGADRFVEFQRSGNGSTIYLGRNGAGGYIKYTSGSPDLWEYHDQHDNKAVFFGGNTSSNKADWQLWKLINAAGAVAYVGDASTAATAVTNGYNGSGQIVDAYDSEGRRFVYTYTTGRLTQVKVQTYSGSWTDTGYKVDYAYYPTSVSHGLDGDLKTATVQTPLSPSSTYDIRQTYYRYWKNADSEGDDHQIKLVIGPEGTRRYDWLDTTFDDDHFAETDANLKTYSDAYLEYDSDARVVKGFFNGQCGCGGGSANGEHTIEYEDNGSYTDNAGYDTTWARRTIVVLPDDDMGTSSNNPRIIQYFDEAGQALSTVMSNAIPTSGSPEFQPTEVVRTAAASGTGGLVSTVYSPAANDTYTHSTGAFSHTNTGFITVYTRISAANYDSVQDFVEHVKFKTVYNGTAYLLKSHVYAADTDTTWRFKDSPGSVDLFRPNLLEVHNYPTQTSSAFSGSLTTIVRLTPDSTVKLAAKKGESTPPTVSTGENGSGSANNTYQAFALDGRPTFRIDPLGVVTYMEYTGGLVTKSIQDADTTLTAGGQDFNGVTIPSGFSTAGSGTVNHVKTTYAYDGQGRTDTVTHPDGRISKNYYTRLKDRRLVTLSIPKVSGTVYTGPISYTVTNHAGQAEVQATMSLGSGTYDTSGGGAVALASWVDTNQGTVDPITAFSSTVGAMKRLARSYFNEPASLRTSSRAYFTIPASEAADSGANYDLTTYGYDNRGRLVRTEDPTGTVHRTRFDVMGRVLDRWIGSIDNDAAFADPKDVAGSPDMVKIEALTYDDPGGGSPTAYGNNNVLTRTQFIVDSTTGQRVTSMLYDARNRAVVVLGPQAPYMLNKFDNMGRTVAVGLYSSTSGLDATDDPSSLDTNRVGYSQSLYDTAGRIYSSIQHKIDQVNGDSEDSIASLTWYDPVGRVMKVKGEQLTKTIYDRLGRPTRQYVLAMALTSTSAEADTEYANAGTVTDDVVLEETVTGYEATTGNVLIRSTVSRHHTDIGGGSTTGALDTNADGDLLKVTAANIKGRVQITAMWYDSLNRLTETVSYGTNAIVGDGSTSTGTLDRTGLSTPSRGPTVLRTSYGYDVDGAVRDVTDPNGIITRTVVDGAGRRTAVIRNYVNGTPSGNTADDDVYTRYVYTNGHMSKMWVDFDGDNAVDADDQETTYTYGVTKGASFPDSKITNGNLLKEVVYPEQSSGQSSSDRKVLYAYNALGQLVYTKDQLSTEIETVYDTGGRVTDRKVTLAGGSPIDNAVLRISMTYNSRGMVETVTQYDAASSGNAVDQVVQTYDGWGMLVSFKQDIDSILGASGNDEMEVAYVWSKAGSTETRQTLRKDEMEIKQAGTGKYVIEYEYLSSSDRLDDAVSRVTQVKKGATVVAEYKYSGAAMVIETDLPQPQVRNRLHAGTTGVLGATYTNLLDQFNRVSSWRWDRYAGGSAVFWQVDLTYDENSNILTTDDAVYAGWDVKYTIDDLDRVTGAEEGTLSTGSIGSRTRNQAWTLSHTGQWNRNQYDTNGDNNYSDPGELDENNTLGSFTYWGKDNSLKARNTNNAGPADLTLTYDKAGQREIDGIDQEFEYDAFGRLRRIENNNGGMGLMTEYRYNGLGMRIAWRYDVEDSTGGHAPDGTVDGYDPWYYFLNNERWQQVATFRGTTSTPDAEAKEVFVHHNAGFDGMGGSSYIDSLILRDLDTSVSWPEATTTVTDERRYLLQNWRADVVAVMGTTGIVYERVWYSSYGIPRWTSPADGWTFGSGTVNPDGFLTSDDETYFLSDYGGSSKHRFTDLDNSDTLTSADVTAFYDIFFAGTASSGALSLYNNRKGYAAYEFEPVTVGAYYHVRHRVLDSQTGQWLTRDPLTYVDGSSLYQYCSGRPLVAADATGMRMLEVAFNAFISGGRGGMLPEPLGLGHFDGEYYFSTDRRGFGQFNFSLANPPPNARLASIAMVDSTMIGAAALYAGVLGDSAAGQSHRYIHGSTGLTVITAQAQVSNGVPDVSNPELCVTEVIFEPSASYPFTPFWWVPKFAVPSIDYRVGFRFTAFKESYVLIELMEESMFLPVVNVSIAQYWHNEFPDYEAYIEHSLVYTYASGASGPNPLNLANHVAIPHRAMVVAAETPAWCSCQPNKSGPADAQQGGVAP